MNGGDGFDFVSYADAVHGVQVRFDLGIGADGDAENDVYHMMEGIIGSESSDYLAGNNLANGICGGGGDDILFGNGGADNLIGGSGSDNFALSWRRFFTGNLDPY